MRRPMVQVFVRLVWATWDRQPVLGAEPRRVAYRAIQAVCQELRCGVMALDGTADRVHLLVR